MRMCCGTLCGLILGCTAAVFVAPALGEQQMVGPDVTLAPVIINNGATALWTDGAGDQVLRRTDPIFMGNAFPYAGTIPDLLSIRMHGWEGDTDAQSVFVGNPSVGPGTHLFRMDMVFDGLVNPPGTIGLRGLPFDPFRFGENPVFGFVEIDIDGNINTGGELGDPAKFLYLANAGRFGGLPFALRGTRTAADGNEVDSDFLSTPQYERSGAEFLLALCGCFDVGIVSEGGNGDGVFDRDEEWIVSGRFFQRMSSFSQVSSAFNGSEPNLYDPVVELRFKHTSLTGRTTVSLVFPLDQVGAAIINGGAVQPMNTNVGDHVSVQEAMADVINFINVLPPTGPLSVLLNGWKVQLIDNFLVPSGWHVTALFGVTYPAPQSALYVYTDLGFDHTMGDVNGDGEVGPGDRVSINANIALLDGTARDADGVSDGVVGIPTFARNFSVYDVNYDGFIDDDDSDLVDPVDVAPILGDINGDGVVNASDLALLLGSWGSEVGPADINEDGIVNASDLALLLGNWGASN